MPYALHHLRRAAIKIHADYNDERLSTTKNHRLSSITRRFVAAHRRSQNPTIQVASVGGISARLGDRCLVLSDCCNACRIQRSSSRRPSEPPPPPPLLLLVWLSYKRAPAVSSIYTAAPAWNGVVSDRNVITGRLDVDQYASLLDYWFPSTDRRVFWS